MNGTYGRFDRGDIYGVVVMPSMFIIEDRLEAVLRYQWASSTELQLRPGRGGHTSVRAFAEADGVKISKGDENHTFYAGLNYYFCEDNLKLMAGVEHETLTGGMLTLKRLRSGGRYASFSSRLRKIVRSLGGGNDTM